MKMLEVTAFYKHKEAKMVLRTLLCGNGERGVSGGLQARYSQDQCACVLIIS